MRTLDPASGVGVVVSTLAHALNAQRLVLLQQRAPHYALWRVACLLAADDGPAWHKRLQLFTCSPLVIRHLQPESLTASWSCDWFTDSDSSAHPKEYLNLSSTVYRHGGMFSWVHHNAIQEWEAQLPFRGLEVYL